MTEGLTFWGWVVGEHPKLKEGFGYLIIIAMIIIIAYYVGSIGAILFIGSLILFFNLIKNLLSVTESNLLLVIDPEKPSIVGVHLIGSKKWKNLILKKGDLIPFTTSTGTHAIFSTSYDGENITASWIHEIGRTEFLTKSTIYEQSLTIAEDCYKQLSLIRDIPRLMGVKIAGMSINVYEQEKLRDISSLDPAFKDDELIKMLDNLKDPLDIIRQKERMEKTDGVKND